MPSLCFLLVTCLTAAVQITTTSWKTSSCASLSQTQLTRTFKPFISTHFELHPTGNHNSRVLQVCGEQSGDARCRGLPDYLHEWSNSSEQDAWHQLAEEMLPNDRQKVRKKFNKLIDI